MVARRRGARTFARAAVCRSRRINTDVRDTGITGRTEWTPRQIAGAAALTAIAYWIAARLGMALTFGPVPVAVVWPPNAVLLAALLLAPTSAWWLLLLSALPVHLGVEISGGVPVPMALSWYLSNCVEAVLGAGLVRVLIPGRARLDTTEAFGVFVVCATILATMLSSFLDAGFVSWNRWGRSTYWTVWRTRFLSNVLATQTIVPMVLVLRSVTRADLAAFRTRRIVEAACLAAALVLTCGIAFWTRDWQSQVGPTLLFAPIPVLLWAAVRFGPIGVVLSVGAVTFLAIWGVVRGGGPFTSLEPAKNALSLQLFLFLTSVPLVLLATTGRARRRAEGRAAESERLLSMTIKAAHIGLWTVDLDTGRFSADDVVIGMMGHPAMQRAAYAELIAVGPSRRARPSGEHTADGRAAGNHPQDEASSTEAEPAPANVETIIPERELEVRLLDGSVRCILARGMLLRRPGGRPHRAMGVAMDITDRKHIERAMRDYDERLSLAATTFDVGFWTLDLATDDVWLSDQCYTLAGAQPGADPTATLNRLIPGVSAGDVAARVESTFGRRGALLQETQIAQPGGSVRYVASSARVERSTSGYPVRIIGVSRDISDRREAERQAGERQLALAHLSRVATVGELTATIVHEVGQPLGAIALNAQAAQRLAHDAAIDVPELRSVAGDLVRDARRAATVIGQLRDLLRRDEKARQLLDLGAVVQDTLDLARGELAKQDISLVLGIPDDRLMVHANRAQLQQVLLNVILNARDAILSSSTRRRQLVVSLTKGTDSFVSVWIADSGGGIAREHLGQVFEPFFTSKPEGLGLGLAVSRSIMLDHGGDLRAENVEGGALLQVVLPQSNVRPARAPFLDWHATAYSPRAQPPSAF